MLLDLFSIEYAQPNLIDTHDYADWIKRRDRQQQLAEARIAEKLAYAEQLKQQIKGLVHPEHEEVVFDVVHADNNSQKQHHYDLSALHTNLARVEDELIILRRQIREEDDIYVILLSLN
jgi:hypothetical protein